MPNRDLFRQIQSLQREARLSEINKPKPAPKREEYVKKESLDAVRDSLQNTIDYLESVIEEVKTQKKFEQPIVIQRSVNIPVSIEQGGTGATTVAQALINLGLDSILDTITTKTANYTATSNDDVILCDATAGGFTITLPACSGISGKRYIIKKIDSSSNVVVVDGNASETIDGALTKNLQYQYKAITVYTDGSNWYITG